MSTRHPIRNSLLPLLFVAGALSAYDYYEDRSITWHQQLISLIQQGFDNLLMSRQAQQEAPFIVERSDRAERLPATYGASGQRGIDDSEPRFELVGRVSRVIDGDSFEVRVSDREYTIRLFGIDTPEGDQPHGEEAARALTRKIDSHRVAVQIRDLDDYSRLVGTVYYQGENVNLAMVAEGHGWWYERYAGSEKELEKAQATARAADLGLWADPNPIAPWDWRRTKGVGVN